MEGDGWDQWDVSEDEEIDMSQNESIILQFEDKNPILQFAISETPKEIETPIDTTVNAEIQDRINSLLVSNEKYLREVAEFNAKPRQSFTATRYPNNFKLATY